MLYGLPPPTPKETIQLLDDIFVKKEKLLEKKYVETLEKIRTIYKDIEHGKVTEVSGKDIDDMLKNAEEYLKRIKELFKQIEEKTERESILDVYDMCLSVTKDMLAEKGVKTVPEGEIEALFKKHIIEEEGLPEKFLRILKEVKKAKEDFVEGKITKHEVHKVKKDARLFIRTLVEHMQRKKVIDLERIKVRFKYGDKLGEVMLFEDAAFIIKDLEEREKILRADITKEGGLENIKPSTPEELEKYINKFTPTKKIFIKEKIFEDLRALVGEEIELLFGH